MFKLHQLSASMAPHTPCVWLWNVILKYYKFIYCTNKKYRYISMWLVSSQWKHTGKQCAPVRLRLKLTPGILFFWCLQQGWTVGKQIHSSTAVQFSVTPLHTPLCIPIFILQLHDKECRLPTLPHIFNSCTVVHILMYKRSEAY